MLKLSVKTRLNPEEALDRAKKHFEDAGLTLIETIAHLHAKGGFTEIRVSGGKLLGKEEYDSKAVLDELAKSVKDKFGFEPVSYSLHYHTSVGYVDVHVSNEKPVEVTLETLEYDYDVKRFADSLPKA